MISHRLSEIPESAIDEIQFEIPEASIDSVIWAIKKSIEEFCELSHYWKEDIGPVRVVPGCSDYDIAAYGNAAIVSIINIKTNSTDGRSIQLERIPTDDVRYRFWQYTPFSITVSPVDELTGLDLSVFAALKPIDCSSRFEFSEHILIDYQDAILSGARARLYEVPRKPWFDPALHQKNRSIFVAAASDALRSQGRGYSRLPDRSSKQKARSFY